MLEPAVRHFCSVCGDTADFSKLFDIRDYRGTRVHSIVQCPRCRVLKTHPVPEDLASYYNTGALTSAQNPIYHRMKRVLLRQEINRIVRHSGSGSFLDLGSGYGDFSELLSDMGYSVVAADAANDRPFYVRERSDIPYVRFDYGKMQIEKPELAEGRTLVLRNVLEHVAEPDVFLDNFISAGISHVYIAVPNVSSLERKVFGEYDYSWHIPFHLWHFNSETLGALLNRVGLNVVKSGHYTIPTTVCHLYRYLVLNNYSAGTRRFFDPNGWVSALSVPLNMLFFRRNVLWVVAAVKSRAGSSRPELSRPSTVRADNG
jgi:SAM-dependent methyltransferase